MRQYVLWTIVAMLVVMMFSYLERGYFAFGVEVFFPMASILMYKAKRASN